MKQYAELNILFCQFEIVFASSPIHPFIWSHLLQKCLLFIIVCRVSFFVHHNNSSWMINTRNKTHNVLYKFRSIKFPESLEVKLKPQCIYRCQENVNINIMWFTDERCISGFLPKNEIYFDLYMSYFIIKKLNCTLKLFWDLLKVTWNLINPKS